MIATERFLPDHQRSLVEFVGIGVAAMVTVEHCQVLERIRDTGMVGTERFVPD
jgi:hypothetical protein